MIHKNLEAARGCDGKLKISHAHEHTDCPKLPESELTTGERTFIYVGRLRNGALIFIFMAARSLVFKFEHGL